MKKVLLLPILLVAHFLQAQSVSPAINPALFHTLWSAKWIAVPNEPTSSYGVYHFRKTITLPALPKTFIVHVSGDNRYKLLVNGQLVSLGPARSDFYNWNYETIDLTPFLKSGQNVVASVVWNFGDQTPEAQISSRTGFILQGDSEQERILDTDKTWKCIRNQSYTALPVQVNGYYVAGPGEKIDGSQYAWGWETADFNDSSWTAATEISPGVPKGHFEDHIGGWQLVPRSIPAMELKPTRLVSVRRASGISPTSDFPSKHVPLQIPAKTKVTLILDQSHLTNAYPVLSISGGKGTTLSLCYAEALFLPEGKTNIAEMNNKGNRNEVEGKVFIGQKDEFTTDGGFNRTFSPLWWRTYRFIELSVETKEEVLTINDLYGLYTAYPFDRKARFEANNAELNKILEVGWRTARLCANETYMDCPYYEQLQYVGDTRIQALVSLYNSGDDRLARNALIQIRNSASTNVGGLTMSRFPTRNPQYIPPFSLWWIGMVNDYWMYRGDSAFIQSMLPVSRLVLQFYAGYQKPDGTLKKVSYWNFTDWPNDANWKHGVPVRNEEGNSAIMDLQLLMAYQAAAPLEEALGMKAQGEIYRQKIEQLKYTIRKVYWDQEKQLFADTPDKKLYSQHTNSMAVLTGLVQGDEAKKVMEKTLTDTNLTPCTIYFKYYLHQAATKAGLGDRYIDLLGEWRTQLSNGLTTWAELPEPTRSDCHAWGASPNIELYRTVLGIDTDAAGFNKVRIQPNLGNLKTASGAIPHPKGEIAVKYQLDKKGKLTTDISLPAGVEGTFIWKGQSYPINGGIKKQLALN